jgi:hypothetical protein
MAAWRSVGGVSPQRNGWLYASAKYLRATTDSENTMILSPTCFFIRASIA